MINNNKFKSIFRIVWLIFSLIATIATLTDHVAAFNGDGRPAALFFTSWSVWLALVTAIAGTILILTKKEDSQWYCLLKFCADIMLIATFIVAGFVLPTKIWTASYWTFGGTFKHFFVPILTVADTILFDKKDSYKVYFPFAGIVIPLIYWVILIIRICVTRNAMGGAIPANLWDFYYPYGFTNIDNGHSLAGLCKLLSGITVGLIVIGFGFFFGKKSYKK